MSNLTVTGTLDTVYAETQVTDKFKKREFILRIADKNPEYDQLVKFELHQDKTDIIDAYSTGDKIEVTFNLRGRKHTGQNGINYYVSLQAWKIQKHS